MPQLILDTDIGTDVDDALALAMLLGSPEVELLGVTSVYGDTLLRAQLAKRLTRLSHSTREIPFIPGASETLSGRPVWWAGHEGALFDDLAEESVNNDLDAVQFLTQTVAAAPGTIDIIAIGPLTNIALCLREDPFFSDNVGKVYVMGGDFSQPQRTIEHNFRCDAEAAQEVFASTVPLTVVGLDVTTQVALTIQEIERIERSGRLGIALRAEIEQFWKFHGHLWNNPHDPIAALAAIRPDLFTREMQHVEVLTGGEQAGLVRSDALSAHAVEVITQFDAEAVVEEIVARVVAASRNEAGQYHQGHTG